MTRKEKVEMCQSFFHILAEKLNEQYEILRSCNEDISAYLCPIGTTDEVTYHSKPEMSFRISDHWNWYANTNKCPNPKYIQCYCEELPYAHKRKEENKAEKPILASCVSLFKNGKYHVIYGEYFDKKHKTWNWLNNSPEQVISELFNC